MPELQLTYPMATSPRLLPAVRIGEAWLSAEDLANEVVFHLDAPGFATTLTGFQPGAGDEDVRSWMGGFLSFLTAAGEGRRYRIRTGRESENESLFLPSVVDWIEDNLDEIDRLQFEISEVGHA